MGSNGKEPTRGGDGLDPSVAARRRAAALAGHRGDRAAIAAGLVDEAPRVRATALRSSSRVGIVTNKDLAMASNDPDPLVRATAAEMIGTVAAAGESTLATTELVGCLRALLADIDHSVAEAAAFAAGELGADGTPLLDLMIALVDHADAIVRETAVAALGAIGDPAALPTILAATDDRATVRRRAVIALAPFEGSAVDAALVAACEDRDWQVRQAAEDQLAILERDAGTPRRPNGDAPEGPSPESPSPESPSPESPSPESPSPESPSPESPSSVGADRSCGP